MDVVVRVLAITVKSLCVAVFCAELGVLVVVPVFVGMPVIVGVKMNGVGVLPTGVFVAVLVGAGGVGVSVGGASVGVSVGGGSVGVLVGGALTLWLVPPLSLPYVALTE